MNKNVLWSVGTILMISGIFGAWMAANSRSQATAGELVFVAVTVIGVCLIMASVAWDDEEPDEAEEPEESDQTEDELFEEWWNGLRGDDFYDPTKIRYPKVQGEGRHPVHKDVAREIWYAAIGGEG